MTNGVVRAQGAVAIGPASFVVQELPVEAEVSLRVRLRALARQQLGPGSFYANIYPAAEYARKLGQHQDAANLVSSVAPLIATQVGASEDAAELYRMTPDGVAWELYYRTRETHPDAEMKEFRAVLNEVNAFGVYMQILRAIDPGKAETPSS